MTKVASLKKPLLSKPVFNAAAARAFAEGSTGAQTRVANGVGAAREETALTGQKSGLVPEGDVRLTANIRADLHLALKIRAAQERTTAGELIEQWIANWR